MYLNYDISNNFDQVSYFTKFDGDEKFKRKLE